MYKKLRVTTLTERSDFYLTFKLCYLIIKQYLVCLFIYFFYYLFIYLFILAILAPRFTANENNHA